MKLSAVVSSGKNSSFKNWVVLFAFMLSSFLDGNLLAQTLPSASSCTSKDLELKSVKLAYTGLCFPYGQPTNVILEINNKTGSVRTAFACWAKLVRTTKAGVELAPVSIYMCGGPIQPSTITSITTATQITVNEGESIVLKDLFLAWTTSNANQNCDFLKNNSATINPKCGILPSIKVEAGVIGALSQSASVCGEGGSLTNLTISPYGGVAPYKVSIDDGSEINVAASGSHTFYNINAAVVHNIKIKDKNGCLNTVSSTISTTATVVAKAGNDFTKNCLINISGNTIGETTTSGFTYSWSPATGLSNSAVADPMANPTSTTTYTVTKTNVATGCKGTDEVIVTVDNDAVTAFAGNAFTKTCTENLTGKEIGEPSSAGFTYSWTPSVGLSGDAIANPLANPSSSATFTVTKTNTSTGCSGTSQVTITVNDTKPDFSVTFVQPTVSLCAAATLGSVTFCAVGGSGFEYSIDNGSTYSSTSSFNNLASGSVTGLKVKNSYGCLTSASCETVGNCSSLSTSPVPTTVEGTVMINAVPSIATELKPIVKAYPNPFSGRINFNLVASRSGKAALEIFDPVGRRIGIPFQGMMEAREMKTVVYDLPLHYNGTLIYRFTSGGTETNGKIISSSK
ncbi:MAG: hypothetical protein ACK4YD_06610 [Chitinophagia bacterium]|jgi:hypothetical protein